MDTAVGLAALIAVLVVSITAHEFMHAWVSWRLGDETARYSGRLSLNPLVHIDPFTTVLLPIFLYLAGLPVFGAAKPVPFNPQRLRHGDLGAAMVAVAGPLTNLLLAAFFSLWLRWLPLNTVLGEVMVLFVLVNIGFFVFNLIPFPPLDGSRLLYALVPESLRALMRQIENFGLVGIMIFLFLLFPVISPTIGRLIVMIANLLLPGFSARF
ncbi:site-2 protease family protein [Candidatus Microgenomates bacterium]|nr:site-2 protease family protein [Candidatus Microgenomates bacterium]